MKNLLGAIHANLVFGRRVRVLAEQLGKMIPHGSEVLDVGCGDGQISARVARKCEGTVTGVDVLVRPSCRIPVKQFDGLKLPFPDSSFDAIMFVDVLHHTENPDALLCEARRVTRKYVLLKDHSRDGFLAELTLRFMDWFGNRHHGVVLPYNYLSNAEWKTLFDRVGLKRTETHCALGLYPRPFAWVFERSLHFITLLQKEG